VSLRAWVGLYLAALTSLAPPAWAEPNPSPSAGLARAADPPPRFAWPRPTWVWALTQLAPSAVLRLGGDAAEPALRWQVTPLAYAFGLDPRLPRWRGWVVEPLARHAGSVELAVQPELAPGAAHPWGARAWARLYLPLAERGEALSASVAVGYQRTQTYDAPALEVGVYALFGVLGLQLSHALAPDHAGRTTLALSVRYF
jgi:hypothetical protein